MTYNPNADREYWRMSNDKALIEAARYSNHDLSIALGERLEDATGVDVEHLQQEIAEQEARINILVREVARLEHLLATPDADA